MPIDALERRREMKRGEGDGNTSSSPSPQPLQLRHWSFTWNNYDQSDIDLLESTFKGFKKILRYRFQEETGESGTPHLQGIVAFTKGTRWSELKLPKEIHWEKTRNIPAAEDYCKKEDTRTGKIYEFGFPEELEGISQEDFFPWQSELFDVFMQKPDKRKVYWYWSEEGGTGKSGFATFLYDHFGAVVLNAGDERDINFILSTKDMAKCKIVVFDIPRKNKNKVAYEAIESIKNGLICNTKYEGKNVRFNPPHIVVFANSPPKKEFLSEDRWIIKRINKGIAYNCGDSLDRARQDDVSPP